MYSPNTTLPRAENPVIRFHVAFTSRLPRRWPVNLMRPNYRAARNLGMTSRAAWSYAKLATDCGI